jgi:hypothetical protein
MISSFWLLTCLSALWLIQYSEDTHTRTHTHTHARTHAHTHTQKNPPRHYFDSWFIVHIVLCTVQHVHEPCLFHILNSQMSVFHFGHPFVIFGVALLLLPSVWEICRLLSPAGFIWLSPAHLHPSHVEWLVLYASEVVKVFVGSVRCILRCFMRRASFRHLEVWFIYYSKLCEPYFMNTFSAVCCCVSCRIGEAFISVFSLFLESTGSVG